MPLITISQMIIAALQQQRGQGYYKLTGKYKQKIIIKNYKTSQNYSNKNSIFNYNNLNLIKTCLLKKTFFILGKYVPGCLDVMLGYGETSQLMRVYYPTSSSKNVNVST